ncbi:FxsA family protein [Methylobacillus flagellatus]|uniref:FxsA family protein n=1 Tax=Methylobacillus flagellatus TaxID=405 RepID=UPI0010F6DB84|nr:FxsA family protein [Methylobacillus flagellatus]
MRLVSLLAILLVFPVLEIWLLITLADEYGWAFLIYLLLVGVLGWRLLRDEKANLQRGFTQGMPMTGNPLAAVLGSAKNLVAGVLLLIPGVLTDIIALVLLLLPGSSLRGQAQAGRAANDDIIEGEYRKVDEPPRPRLPEQ